MWPRVGDLRAFDLGSEGAMREELNRLVLAGEKVATAGLWGHDYAAEDEVLDEVGERQVLLGSDGAPLALVEITRIETHRFIDVTWEFAAAEGEGFTSVDGWRAGHLDYWTGEGFTVTDDALTVCVWFRVVEIMGSDR